VNTALITGITGQDGFHLTKLLLGKNYRVIGVSSGLETARLSLFKKLYPNVRIHVIKLTDIEKLKEVILLEQPNEVYNLAAISSVARSIREPELTHLINYQVVVNLIDLLYSHSKQSDVKFYQSSSSEMYGGNDGVPINENSKLNPISPYGEAKAEAHAYCSEFRKNNEVFISQGILFNHESEFRQSGFVSLKIIDSLILIKRGKLVSFELGDTRPARDWGYAGDYVNAMHLMLQHTEAEDFVIASGKSHTIKEFVNAAISEIGLPGSLNDYVRTNTDLIRENEFFVCVGDPTKARIELNWTSQYNFNELINLIIQKRELNFSGL
jgi:GDPmannose 4,6-dehydratase